MSPLPAEKPNFFLLGAPKCGTTALAQYLSEHPAVLFSEPKEPKYFNTDFSPIHRRCLTPEEYARCFDPALLERCPAVGEGTVWYLYSQVAVANILAAHPQARFLVMVRNPLELAPSLHSQLLWGGEEDEPDFARAWALQDERRRGRSVPATCPDPQALLYGEVARLGEQLQRLYRQVPRERVFVGMFDDLRREPERLHADVLRFLDLPHQELSDYRVVNANRQLRRPRLARMLYRGRQAKLLLGIRRSLGVWERLSPLLSRRAPRPPLAPAVVDSMRQHFADDVALLGELVGRDLGPWLAQPPGAAASPP
ncbi:MAG TPA: sulfotransferase [Thermoanaerobaculia bacterium]|nr:sulfotransferase [Thermoanaerobaculia bacterium]